MVRACLPLLLRRFCARMPHRRRWRWRVRVSSKSDDDTIVVGREIRFSVERLHEAAGLISISASMKQPGTGPTAAPVEETPPELQLLQVRVALRETMRSAQCYG